MAWTWPQQPGTHQLQAKSMDGSPSQKPVMPSSVMESVPAGTGLTQSSSPATVYPGACTPALTGGAACHGTNRLVSALIELAQELGTGSWKAILEASGTVFSGRTTVRHDRA